MNFEFINIKNECDILPRLTVNFPFGIVQQVDWVTVYIYIGFLWWTLIIRFGDTDPD